MRNAETTLAINQEAIPDRTYWRAGRCENIKSGSEGGGGNGSQDNRADRLPYLQAVRRMRPPGGYSQPVPEHGFRL